MERSYVASQAGLTIAKREFKKKGWTQQILADLAGCSRPVVSNFFKGIPIDKQKFIGICEALKLEYSDIVELEDKEKAEIQDKAITELVEEIRNAVKASVEKECGTMRVLDMTRPIELNDIYTKVNILEKIIGRRGLNLEQLQENCQLEDFDRFGLNTIKQKRVPGLEVIDEHNQLMILGKPGAGKTTFLKYLAIQCNRGEFAAEKVPIFIPLKKYAETRDKPDLVTYINLWLENCQIIDAKEKLERILVAGKGLVLLDGLDEVREEDTQRIIRDIENLYRAYGSNQFAITCRIAAKEYNFVQFTEVEVADFDDEQIESFVTSWFTIKQLPDYTQDFLDQLQSNPTIKELANSPLLLTLLCVEFEDSGNFPTDRADLYSRATNTLLRKWDDKRRIYREQVYQELTVKRKEGLLSQVAFQTFANKEYFFKQRTIENHIGEYICNLPNAPQEQTALDIDSQAVLKSIEAQHGLLIERARGIYSFSHLTFQEYFTARRIATISNPNHLEVTLTNLASHVTEKRWREVFLLTAAMLEPADRLLVLMKQKIDRLVAEDTEIQDLLNWANHKSNSVEASYKIAAMRAYYVYLSLDVFDHLDHSVHLDLSPSHHFSRSLHYSLGLDLPPDRSLGLSLDRSLSFSLDQSLDFSIDHSLNRLYYLNQSIRLCEKPEFKKILITLQQQLPDPDRDRRYGRKWWQDNGKAWSEDLRQAMIKYRDLGHQREFSRGQVGLLNQYLTANQLLVDCLKSECYVNREVRAELENTLLLSHAESNYSDSNPPHSNNQEKGYD